MKRWRFHPQAEQTLVSGFPDLPPLLVQLLANRGLTSREDIESFLASNYDEHLNDPMLFQHMEKAISRIVQAIEKKERIVLYGDYDVDGVSALSILFVTLRALQVPNVTVTIPDRYRDGYGLNLDAVAAMVKDGTTLLITCDCGTSNVEEIAKANASGIDVIVVDHHKAPPELPKAYAMLNPAFFDEPYPFKKLCSGGVAFKVASALLTKLEYGKDRLAEPLPTGWEKWLLDLVALSTVADMMPLNGENRVLVKNGLTVLRKTRRPGLQALLDVMGTPADRVTTGTIGFQIAPRLNAAGRLKHANAAFTLLTTENADEARKLAEELNQTNQERQRLTQEIFREALEQVRPQANNKLIVARGKGWSSGIIGLVAGKLKEVFHRPALAIGENKDGIVGSGRSVAGFDITQALVESSKYLAKFGGHPMACGFTVASPEAIQGFVDSMTAAAERDLAEKDLTPEILIDQELSLDDLTWGLTELLDRLEPFGIAVPEPIFATQQLRVLQAEQMGRDGKHLRLRFVDADDKPGRAVGFGFGDWAGRLKTGDRLDLAYRVGVHEWNGNKDVQLTLVDLRMGE